MKSFLPGVVDFVDNEVRWQVRSSDGKKGTHMARRLPLRPPSIWASALLATTVVAAQQPAPAPPPLVKEGATVKVAPHVYVIPDASVPVVPNVTQVSTS